MIFQRYIRLWGVVAVGLYFQIYINFLKFFQYIIITPYTQCFKNHDYNRYFSHLPLPESIVSKSPDLDHLVKRSIYLKYISTINNKKNVGAEEMASIVQSYRKGKAV